MEAIFDLHQQFLDDLKEGRITQEVYERRRELLLASANKHAEPNAQERAQTPFEVTNDFRGLAEVLAQQHLAINAPWRMEMADYQAQYNAVLDQAKAANISALQEEVREKALAHELSSWEALCLQYLLFFDGSTDEACRMLATILLRIPPASRNKMHNWGAIAANMDAGDLNIHGKEIASIHCALFPPKTCRAANDKLFAVCCPTLHGGSEYTPAGQNMSLFYRSKEGIDSPLCDGQKGHFFSESARHVAGANSTEAQIKDLQSAIALLQGRIAALSTPHQSQSVENSQAYGKPKTQRHSGQAKNGAWGSESWRQDAPKN